MTDRAAYVIVGANLAGGSAAQALRDEGFDGRIVMVGAEPHPPYMRPPLSKEFLLGDGETEHLYIQEPSAYEELAIELKLGSTATGLDTASRDVTLATGERIPFDRLLIATGADVRRLRVPGADLRGIHYLRTIEDAEALRISLNRSERVTVIGAGFIGAEIAAAARQLGRAVTMVEMQPAPLQQALGGDVGAMFADLYREDGIDLRLGEGVEAFRGSSNVEAVVTASGQEIPCDLVVVGVGVAPRVDWLKGSEVVVGDGVVVDEFLQTNVPGVFAAGDVASAWHPLLQERLRLEHDTNAQSQGMTAARNMMDAAAAYEDLPYFWSDQGDLHLQMVGRATRWDSIIVRGKPESRSFSVFYLAENELKAGLCVNRPKEISALQRLIRSRSRVEHSNSLADEQVELKSLISV